MAHVELSPHLSDAEIDDYWTGRLSDADAQRVELHYLECVDCRQRAAAVETLVEALRRDAPVAGGSARSLRAWQTAAAVFAIVALGSTWQWARVVRDTRRPAGPPPVLQQTNGGAVATLRVAVEPPTRSASAMELIVPPGVSIVVFELDAREVSPPRAVLDVSLTGPRGTVMRVQARSSDESRIEVPAHRGLLEPGQYQFDVTHQGNTVALPVRIQQPNQPR